MQHIFSLITSWLFWLWLFLIGWLWRYFGGVGEEVSSQSLDTNVTKSTTTQSSSVNTSIGDKIIDTESASSTVSASTLISLMDDVGNTSVLDMLRSSSDKDQALSTYLDQLNTLISQWNAITAESQQILTTLQSHQTTCQREQQTALGHMDTSSDIDTKKIFLVQAQEAAWCVASDQVAIDYHTTYSTLMTRRVTALTAKKNLIETNRNLLIQYTSELAWPIPAQLVDLQKILITQ